jgi:phage head maturation protease
MTSDLVQRAETPPREDLMRMTPFALRAESEGQSDGRTLDGYAAVFNTITIIDSWEGRFKEKLSPGSMKKSFREKPPKIQFDHGRHPLIGSIPIAQPSDGYPREESDPSLAPEGGAHIVARLHDNWLIQPVRDAIAARSVDGMSFRFSVVREVWFTPDGKQVRNDDELQALLRRTWHEDVPDEELLLRDLREVKVPELGPVVFPAYADTSVGVRSQVIDLGRLDDPEERKTLARAVLLADAAELKPPQVTDEADEHGTDEPRSTEESAGEHTSPSAESRKRRDRIRAAAQHFSAYAAALPEE